MRVFGTITPMPQFIGKVNALTVGIIAKVVSNYTEPPLIYAEDDSNGNVEMFAYSLTSVHDGNGNVTVKTTDGSMYYLESIYDANTGNVNIIIGAEAPAPLPK